MAFNQCWRRRDYQNFFCFYLRWSRRPDLSTSSDFDEKVPAPAPQHWPGREVFKLWVDKGWGVGGGVPLSPLITLLAVHTLVSIYLWGCFSRRSRGLERICCCCCLLSSALTSILNRNTFTQGCGSAFIFCGSGSSCCS